MRPQILSIAAQLIVGLSYFCQISWAAGVLFVGQVNSDNINIRTDSTTSAASIATLKKGDKVEVIKELYDWYKIRLPVNVRSYIRKDFVSKIDEKSGMVTAENVNIRSSAQEGSFILGQADKGEVVNILEDAGLWYRIAPVNNSFAWVHKKFINKEKAPLQKNISTSPAIQEEKVFITEGVVYPYGKVLKRQATHKLVSTDKKTFFLKGNVANLNSLLYHKVKILGKLSEDKQQKYQIIEISKIEVID